MKKILFVIAVSLLMLASCQQSGKVSGQGDLFADSIDNGFMTQAEINMVSGEQSVAYDDSIENVYQMLISALPQYEDELNREKSVWEEYQKAVREVAGYGDYGSSSPMYFNDVINQGIWLREVSAHNLWKHIQGESIAFSKIQITDDMIDDAYAAFVEATKENVEQEELAAYQESILKEQKYWSEWMACRASVAQKLPEDIRKVYDDCTNQTKRTKLIQLKNQNRDLGLMSGDIKKCVLSDECSDKELLDYPGFDKVWEKYLKELGL